MTPNYWTKIGLGALAIFAIGMVFVGVGRRGSEWVEHVAHSASTISIPIVFVPFKLDGVNIGSIRRLDVMRDAPEHVTGATIAVKLAELGKLPAEGCALAIDDLDRIGEGATFYCADANAQAADGLVPFGTVRFEPGGAIRDLLLPQEVIDDLASEIGRDIDVDTDVATRIERTTELRDRAREIGAAQVELATAQEQLAMHATAQGVSLKIVSALEQAGVLLQADSNGAALSIYNHLEGDGLLMKADSHGFVLSVKEGGESLVQMRADANGFQLVVTEVDGSTKVITDDNHE
ncbi:MAG: hypothetical protein V3S19_01580 [Gemmatimonadales bacterium]